MIHAVADGKVWGRKCGLWTFYFVCDLKPPVLFCLLFMSVSMSVSDLIRPAGRIGGTSAQVPDLLLYYYYLMSYSVVAV